MSDVGQAVETNGLRLYGTPPLFDLDEFKDRFDVWERQWERFVQQFGVLEPAEGRRARMLSCFLISCLSKATLEVVLSSGLTEKELNSHVHVVALLRQRCSAGQSRYVLRRRFFARRQREGESVDDWLGSLRDLARKCEFRNDCCIECERARILDQLVCGVYDPDAAEELFRAGDTLDLDEALEMLRAAESGRHPAPVRQENTIRRGRRSADRKDRSGNRNADGRKTPTCWRCGELGHVKKVCASSRSVDEADPALDSSGPTAIDFLSESGTEVDAMPPRNFDEMSTATPLRQVPPSATATATSKMIYFLLVYYTVLFLLLMVFCFSNGFHEILTGWLPFRWAIFSGFQRKWSQCKRWGSCTQFLLNGRGFRQQAAIILSRSVADFEISKKWTVKVTFSLLSANTSQ